MKNYIQIGSNTGNDDFFAEMNNLVEKSRIFLFEPNDELIAELENCYSNLKSIHEISIINAAVVHDEKIKELIIYNCSSGLSSVINRKSFSANYTKKQMNCITFERFCTEQNIKEIEKLSVDCEGYDYMIINSINFSKIKIKTIECELWPHDSDSSEEFFTGPVYFESTLLPKISKLYEVSSCVVGGMKSYRFELK